MNVALPAIFFSFLKLGFTAFGGPVAHLAFFRDEFVNKRQWLREEDYAELVALCQFLPGPASSQVGIAIGFLRGGYAGSILAWTAFTLPSAIILILLAIGYSSYNQVLPEGVLLGLKAVTVAVVAQAVWGMSQSILLGKTQKTIAIASAVCILYASIAWLPLLLILACALLGLVCFRSTPKTATSSSNSASLFDDINVSRKNALAWLAAFALVLFFLPMLGNYYPGSELALIDAYYRVGSLVFGGGHVVLPLLEAETVQRTWVEKDAFLVGYGATQAMPGPLFTFSAYLGALTELPNTMLLHPEYQWITRIQNAGIALLAIFLPSFLLVYGTLPFWKTLRTNHKVKAALVGINSCVVGILLAALYNPIFTTALSRPEFHQKQVVAILIAYLALTIWKLPPWLVVVAGALLGLIYY